MKGVIQVKSADDSSEQYSINHFSVSKFICEETKQEMFMDDSYPLYQLRDNSIIKPMHGTDKPLWNAFVKWSTNILQSLKKSIDNGESSWTISELNMILAKDSEILPIKITYSESNKYTINNSISLDEDRATDALSNIMRKVTSSTFDYSKYQNVDSLNNLVEDSYSLREDIKHALRQRTPYHFYYINNDSTSVEKVDVLLNVKRISDTHCALELSAGVWGDISNDNLLEFIEYYKSKKMVLGSHNSKWMQVSPRNLFINTVGRNPSNAEYLLMVNFLQQNRTDEIVASRAKKMLEEIVSNNPTKVCVVRKEGVKEDSRFTHIDAIYVRGIDYDWRIIPKPLASAVQAGRQSVSVSVLTGSESRKVWSSPICIDNTNNNSPLGDQIATRILATMNDKFMLQRVYTVKSAITHVGVLRSHRLNIVDKELRYN